MISRNRIVSIEVRRIRTLLEYMSSLENIVPFASKDIRRQRFTNFSIWGGSARVVKSSEQIELGQKSWSWLPRGF
jgi:hypothetical protein